MMNLTRMPQILQWLALLLGLLLTSPVVSQAPTVQPTTTEPTISLYPTVTVFPTSSTYPTSTAFPTGTALPTITGDVPTPAVVVTPAPIPTEIPPPPPTNGTQVVPTAAPPTMAPPTDPPPPTEAPISVTESLNGATLTLVNAQELATQDVFAWETATGRWFNNYQQFPGVSFMGSTFTVANQETSIENGVSTLTITYSQLIRYTARPGGIGPYEMAALPWNDAEASARYGNILRTEVGSLANVQFPITPPNLPGPPTELPTGAPSVAPQPTAAPTQNTTEVPTMSPTNSSMPSAAPTPNATEVPTGSPTTSSMPTAPNTTASPTDVASSVPTLAPTTSPTNPSPTAEPVPTKNYDYNLEGLTLELRGASEMNEEGMKSFAEVTQSWFSGFYLNMEDGDDSRQRRLRIDQRTLQEVVQDMSTIVSVTNQDVRTEEGTNVNTVTYDQQLFYVAPEDDAPIPADLVTRPYRDNDARREYADLLVENVPAFSNLVRPVATPKLPRSEGDPAAAGKEDDFWTPATIGGIAGGGGLVLLALLAFCCWRCSMEGRDGNNGYTKSVSQPPASFNISNDEDISTIDDPLMRKAPSADPSLLLEGGGYGDQSVATVDYDYSKAYGGGDTSVVSSAGGTMGDTTRQTGEVAASTSLAALGAESQFRAEGGVREEEIVIDAPAGKLGVVIDTPDDGAPVVHAVKDSSVIADQIQVGDKLIMVDTEDVRSMTAIKVSKLISRKSANPSRKLTIVRTSLAD